MLPTSRFSRSVSSRIVVSSSRSCSGSYAHRRVQQARHARLDRRERRAQVVRDRAEHRGAQLVRLGVELGHARSRVEPGAVERRRRLLRRRLQQQELVRRERTPSRRPFDPQRAERHRADHERHDRRRDHRRRRSGRAVARMQLLPVELDRDLARREAERLQQHAREVVEDAVGNLARQQLRRQVAEQPRLAFSPGRARAFLGRRRPRGGPTTSATARKTTAVTTSSAPSSSQREPRGAEQERQRERGQQRRRSARSRGHPRPPRSRSRAGTGRSRCAGPRRPSGIEATAAASRGEDGDDESASGEPSPRPVIRIVHRLVHIEPIVPRPGASQAFHAIFTPGSGDPSRPPHGTG